MGRSTGPFYAPDVDEDCGLGVARGLAYIEHVVDMRVGEFAEGSETRNERLAEAGMPLSICCLKSRMVAPLSYYKNEAIPIT